MSVQRFNSRWHGRKQLFNLKVPHLLLDWLFDPSSLTARLQRHCRGPFRVEVISQKVSRPSYDELRALDLPYGKSALIRQVRLYCGENPVVYARTVIPLKTIKGKQRCYANLGNRSLGGMLFADRSMRRGQVMASRLNQNNTLFKHIGNVQTDIWGRRSVFYVGNKSLLVSEYFLPALLS